MKSHYRINPKTFSENTKVKENKKEKKTQENSTSHKHTLFLKDEEKKIAKTKTDPPNLSAF